MKEVKEAIMNDKNFGIITLPDGQKKVIYYESTPDRIERWCHTIFFLVIVPAVAIYGLISCLLS